MLMHARLLMTAWLVLPFAAMAQPASPAAPTAPTTAMAAASPTTPSASRWDASLSLFALHDSSIGWYSAITPAVGYDLTAHTSLDANITIYPYRLSPDDDPVVPTNQQLVARKGDLGDTFLNAHYLSTGGAWRNVATVTMSLPSGNRTDGLGLGKVTFDGDEHLQRYLGQSALSLDAGFGDSAGYFNRLVDDADRKLGPVAHFQAAFVQWFPQSVYAEVLAYEQLPVGDQKTYSFLQGPGGPPHLQVTGRNISEDNGLTLLTGIPFADHFTATGSYNRSLRLHLDTVAFGVTYSLRPVPRRHRKSLIDRALEEAERGASQ